MSVGFHRPRERSDVPIPLGTRGAEFAEIAAEVPRRTRIPPQRNDMRTFKLCMLDDTSLDRTTENYIDLYCQGVCFLHLNYRNKVGNAYEMHIQLTANKKLKKLCASRCDTF